jgi:putative intracellular protease/amidase
VQGRAPGGGQQQLLNVTGGGAMAQQDARIAIVLTSHGTLGNTGKPTGFHYEELAAPYWVFVDAGYSVDLASIRGGEPPHDPNSLPDQPSEQAGSVSRLRDDTQACAKLRDTVPVGDLAPSAYAAIFLAGGHGTMWDFPDNAELGRLLTAAHGQGRILGAVCHGPAGLIAAQRSDGSPLIRGVRLNAFTDAEEQQVGLAHTVPFLLESRLKELGARFEKSSPFRGCAVHDQGFVTGQNPRSSRAVAERMLTVIAESGTQDAA